MLSTQRKIRYSIYKDKIVYIRIKYSVLLNIRECKLCVLNTLVNNVELNNKCLIKVVFIMWYFARDSMSN